MYLWHGHAPPLVAEPIEQAHELDEKQGAMRSFAAHLVTCLEVRMHAKHAESDSYVETNGYASGTPLYAAQCEQTSVDYLVLR